MCNLTKQVLVLVCVSAVYITGYVTAACCRNGHDNPDTSIFDGQFPGGGSHHKEPSERAHSKLEHSFDHHIYGHYGFVGKDIRSGDMDKRRSKTIWSAVPEDAYIFTADKLDSDYYLHPTVGNGHLATAVHGPNIHMNGLYNGRLGDSHRAIIPTTCDVTISEIRPMIPFKRTYQLNTATGMFIEKLKSDNLLIELRIYAHRKYDRLIVVEIELLKKSSNDTLDILLLKRDWFDSPDVYFKSENSGLPGVSYKNGITLIPEMDNSSLSHVNVYHDDIPPKLTVGKNDKKWTFLTSIAATKPDALENYKRGVSLLSHNSLDLTHTAAWESIWTRGHIYTEGNIKLAKAIFGSLYYLLSSLPLHNNDSWPFIGLSPGGLPFGKGPEEYLGHVFWDQDIWMYPSILMLHADLAKILIGTRERTIGAAANNAKLNNNKGLQYPWESAFTGAEVCPGKEYSLHEIHISGDVAQAVLQYLYATNDSSILSPPYQFLDLLAGVADFWVSKLVYNDTLQLYTILDVMPPDEYHTGVNNSAYTNAVADLSIEAAIFAHEVINKSSTRWKKYINKIYIPFDEKLKYHPEYDGYTIGTNIKQADVVLMGYPLMWNMPPDVRANDLHIYEQVTDPGGPAMTWAMHTIGWLELGNMTRAHELFLRNYEYIKTEFQIWTEEKTSSGGCPNFLTGIGGFLQAIIFGYGGIRLHNDHLDIYPTLPTESLGLNFTGLDYLDNSLDLRIYGSGPEVEITVTSRGPGAPVLTLHITEDPIASVDLIIGRTYTYRRRRAYVTGK